jgi:hypothetical protein
MCMLPQLNPHFYYFDFFFYLLTENILWDLLLD